MESIKGILEFTSLLEKKEDHIRPKSSAVVSEIEDDGTVWVRYSDGSESPVHSTLAQVKLGQTVVVSVSKGRAEITGNADDLPATESDAATINEIAVQALDDASTAASSATAAASAATEAQTNAQSAKQAADAATSSLNLLTSRVEDAEDGIDALESRTTTAEGKITTVESDIASLGTRTTTAEGKISTVEGDITSLQGRVSQAESDIDDALDEAKTYTDTAKADMKSYTDTAKSDMKSYTDTAKSDMKSYTDTAKSDMKAYTDTAKNAVQGDLDSWRTDVYTPAIASINTNVANAQTAATSANTAAQGALHGLSDVERVVGTLNWIAKHGRYESAAGTAFEVGKVYYTRTGKGTDADPYVYEVVGNPTADALSSYYLLAIDESVQNYIASHLALMDDGLYVTKDGSGYKVRVTVKSVDVIDPKGNLVSSFGESIAFNSERPQTIGGEKAYIKWHDANNDGTADTLTIAADRITMGGNALLDASDGAAIQSAAASDATAKADAAQSAAADAAAADATSKANAAQAAAISAAATDATSKANDAKKHATNYLTDVGNSGVSVHPSGSTANRAVINDSGMEVFKDNASVAFYGDTARVGKDTSANVYINSSGIANRSGTRVLSKQTASGFTVYDGAGTASSNVVASLTGSRAQIGKNSQFHTDIVSDGIRLMYGSNLMTAIDAAGFTTFDGYGVSVFNETAQLGSGSVRVGSLARMHLSFDSDGGRMSVGNGTDDMLSLDTTVNNNEKTVYATHAVVEDSSTGFIGTDIVRAGGKIGSVTNFQGDTTVQRLRTAVGDPVPEVWIQTGYSMLNYDDWMPVEDYIQELAEDIGFYYGGRYVNYSDGQWTIKYNITQNATGDGYVDNIIECIIKEYNTGHFYAWKIFSTTQKRDGVLSLSIPLNIKNPSGRLGSVFDLIYPVGSIYLSINATNPSTLFGGEWESIKGRFLVGAGSNGASGNQALNLTAGTTGGEAEHLLNADETAIAAHTHNMTHGHGFTNPSVSTPKLTHSVTQPVFKTPYSGDTAANLSGSNPSNMGNVMRSGTGTSVTNTRSTNVAVGDHAATACTVSGGAVSSYIGSTNNLTDGEEDALSPHNNLPPYLAVYMWKRIA